MRVSILTVSDSVSKGKTEDRSGPAVASRCKELGWEIASATVLPDDGDAIKGFLADIADSKSADVILTTGGTGFGPRDVTPEATIAASEKLAPGLAELMRAEGRKKTKFAVMSRGVVAIQFGLPRPAFRNALCVRFEVLFARLISSSLISNGLSAANFFRVLISAI